MNTTTPHATHTLDTTAFALLARLHRRLDGQAHATQEVLDAVTVLTNAADPSRAARLRPRAGEPAVLVSRLAAWALHRVDPSTIATADAVLGDRLPDELAAVRPQAVLADVDTVSPDRSVTRVAGRRQAASTRSHSPSAAC